MPILEINNYLEYEASNTTFNVNRRRLKLWAFCIRNSVGSIWTYDRISPLNSGLWIWVFYKQGRGMKEIHAWRKFIGDKRSPAEAAYEKAMEFFIAEGLTDNWLEKAVRQVVELVEQHVGVDMAIRNVDSQLWNIGNRYILKTVGCQFGFLS